MSLANKCLLTAFSTLETNFIAQKTSLSQYESEVPFQTGVQSNHELVDIYHGKMWLQLLPNTLENKCTNAESNITWRHFQWIHEDTFTIQPIKSM